MRHEALAVEETLTNSTESILAKNIGFIGGKTLVNRR